MIPPDKLEEYVEDFLEDFENLGPGGKVDVSESPKSRIEVTERPSKNNTIALTYSTIVDGQGIPLEVRINEDLDYSAIILKCDQTLPEYSPFSQDRFGNYRQMKKIYSTDKNSIESELEGLVTEE